MTVKKGFERKQLRKARLWIFTILGSAVMLTACAGKEDPQPTTTSSQPTEVTAETTTMEETTIEETTAVVEKVIPEIKGKEDLEKLDVTVPNQYIESLLATSEITPYKPFYWNAETDEIRPIENKEEIYFQNHEFIIIYRPEGSSGFDIVDRKDAIKAIKTFDKLYIVAPKEVSELSHVMLGEFVGDELTGANLVVIPKEDVGLALGENGRELPKGLPYSDWLRTDEVRIETDGIKFFLVLWDEIELTGQIIETGEAVQMGQNMNLKFDSSGRYSLEDSSIPDILPMAFLGADWDLQVGNVTEETEVVLNVKDNDDGSEFEFKFTLIP